MGGAAGGGGGEQPSTLGVEYSRVTFDSDVNDTDPDPEIVFNIGEITGSVLVQAPDGDVISNNSDVYIGWDDDVDETNGTLLSPGDAISIDLDASDQNLFAIPEDDTDELRVLTVN